jgi:hypothetical protein
LTTWLAEICAASLIKITNESKVVQKIIFYFLGALGQAVHQAKRQIYYIALHKLGLFLTVPNLDQLTPAPKHFTWRGKNNCGSGALADQY